MAVLNVGGGLIASGELTPGSLTRFAIQVRVDVQYGFYFNQIEVTSNDGSYTLIIDRVCYFLDLTNFCLSKL